MSNYTSVHFTGTFQASVGTKYIVLQTGYTRGGNTFGSFSGANILSSNMIDGEVASSTKARVCIIEATSSSIIPFQGAATYEQYSYSHFSIF